MYKKVGLVTLLCVLLLSSAAYAKSNFIRSAIPEEVLEENDPDLTLQYSIQIENIEGGSISKIEPNGETTHLGDVVVPAEGTYQASDGFWAAQYAKAIDDTFGNVVATGVNAMHLRVAPMEHYDPKMAQQGRDAVWKPRLISLLPDREYYKSGPGPHPGRIATNIPGGEKLFGGDASAYVSSPVQYKNSEGEWQSIDHYYSNHSYDDAPKHLRINVYQPKTKHGKIKAMVFENKVGGDVTIEYDRGYKKPIATVLQRVEGTGRFGGSEYADVGRVRANHGGVLDLSTSPKVGFTWDEELRGGFQIVPANHVVYSRYFLDLNYLDRPQYMIVGHLGSTPDHLYNPVYFDETLAYDPHFEAVAPIFSSYIKPKQITTEVHVPEHAATKVQEKPIKGQSTHFVVSKDGGKTWQDPESIQGSHNDSLIDVTHIKVILNY
ncbi:hypothetical protein [Numidum massiliense]|uniref:hypothetical protein n=1 Tax=Numidum massiliense TaxID=1522315 RepID=UPI0006D57CD1|nr:hypothetical protein [Numidum massiliense]